MPGGVVPPPELMLQWQTDAYPHGIRASPGLTIVSVVFTVLALVVVFCRLHDRVLVRRTAGFDDVLVAIALIPQLGLCVAICLAEQLYGFDRHAWDMTPELAPISRKVTIAISLLYILSTSLTKLSILLFYRRLGKVRLWFKRTIWINMALIVAYAIVFIIAIPLECSPVDAFWNKTNPLWAAKHSYTCVNEGAGNVANGAIGVCQDFIACILPMAIFWDLHITRRAKLALGFVFSLGLFTCVCGILRTDQLHRIFFRTYDTTWYARWAFALTVVESSLGLICASIPALKSSLSRLFSVRHASDPHRNRNSDDSKHNNNPFFRSRRRSSRLYPHWAWGGEKTHPNRGRAAAVPGNKFDHDFSTTAPQPHTPSLFTSLHDTRSESIPPGTPMSGSEFELTPKRDMNV